MDDVSASVRAIKKAQGCGTRFHCREEVKVIITVGMQRYCRPYQTSILLVQQLVPSCQGIPVLLFDQLFHFLVGHADSIVEVPAPENVVVRVQQTTLARTEGRRMWLSFSNAKK